MQHKIPDFHEVIDRAVSARARLRATGQLAGRSEQSEQKEATTVYVNNQQHQDELSVAFSRNGGELPAGTKVCALIITHIPSVLTSRVTLGYMVICFLHRSESLNYF